MCNNINKENIENSKSIYISLIILIPTIIGRILIDKLNDNEILIIMSIINSIALAIVLIIIPYKTYKKMEATQIKLEEKNKDGIYVNSDMKSFKLRIFIFVIIIIFLIIIYLFCLKSNLFNDIFTIISLVLSINDDAFANKIFEFKYKSYYGSTFNKDLEQLKNKYK